MVSNLEKVLEKLLKFINNFADKNKILDNLTIIILTLNAGSKKRKYYILTYLIDYISLDFLFEKNKVYFIFF